jgi:hypothetical protein
LRGDNRFGDARERISATPRQLCGVPDGRLEEGFAGPDSGSQLDTLPVNTNWWDAKPLAARR